jgi:prolyl-tRNA synthetase
MRPRAGLLRGREFIMKDAYSFHTDEKNAQEWYKILFDAYTRIFQRCGLDFRAVEADTGAIGGNQSHEFQVLAASGEDAIVACDTCDYAANVEQAELRDDPPLPQPAPPEPPELVATPGVTSIEEVAKLLGVAPSQTVKTMVYASGDRSELAKVSLRGDRTVNEVRLKKLTGWSEVQLASDADIAALGEPVGFLHPGVRSSEPRLKHHLCDVELRHGGPYVIGANQKDHHLRGAWPGRDFGGKPAPVRIAVEGDRCARCDKGRYRAFRGIEVGHVFYLGTKYSLPMKCNFLDAGGKEQPMPMGCYGIGITRIAAAAIEQNHDADGIVWPLPIAPFQVEVVAAGKEPEVLEVAVELERALAAAGIEVLYDDRDERPGVKFKDADLIGVPIRLTVGKKGLAEKVVELKRRRGGEMVKVPIGEAAAQAIRLVQEGISAGAAR